MPSCYHIFEYWSDKYIDERGLISANGDLKVIQNENFPTCFACGRAAKRKDILSWEKYDVSKTELWSDKRINSTLQKAHIVGQQFGGENKPENLFLLCSDCHYDSPDTQNEAAFMRWVYRRRNRFAYGMDVVGFYEEVQAEIRARGYEPLSFLKKYYDLGYKFSFDLVESAFNKAGTHGANIVPSTLVVCLIDEIESNIIGRKVVI